MKRSAKYGMLGVITVAIYTTVALAGPTTGVPPFQSFGGGPDIINLGNLNVHYSFPIFSRAGRGIPFSYALAYDSSIWTPAGSAWVPVNNWGLNRASAALVGVVNYSVHQSQCVDHNTGQINFFNVYNFSSYKDSGGTVHLFGLGVNDRDSTECGGGNPTATGTATDGSGITMTVTSTPSASVTLRNGEKIAPGLTTGGSTSSGGPQTDSNGNQITSTINGSITTFFDTLSSTTAVLTIDATNATSVLYEYTSPANTTANVTASYVTYNVQTAFGCGINEYGPIQNSLVDRITLPDSSYYQFTYEVTPQDTHTPRYVTGRIASVRLPSGGTISYTYQGGDTGQGIFCADGSTAGFTRTTPDGTWTYVRTGTSPNYTTTITTPVDPKTGQSNQTVVNFQGEFETQRQMYQGAATGTPLDAVTICYNGTPSNPCPGTAVATPFSQITVQHSFNGGSQNRVDTQYNGYGLVTEKDEYDFGATTPARKTSLLYGSYNAGTDSCTALANAIVDHPCKVMVTDGSGNLEAKTTYGYDETAVQTSGVTTNHISVTGSRGNLTTLKTYSTSSTALTSTFNNYDTGNVYQFHDPNGQPPTTYTYGACAGAFLTNVSMPLSLSRSMTWNCTGGVMTSSTDENGKSVSTTYDDPYFWRPHSVSYPDGGQTSMTYNTVTPPWNIQRSSKIDATRNLTGKTVFDILGRVQQTQLTSDPTGTVYTDTVYDSLGRVASVSNPYRSTSDPTYGITSFAYDALRRVTTVTEPGNNTVLTDYTNRATRVQDEGNGNGRVVKIYQSDGLGRLTSVCEVASATQMGITPSPVACGQDIAATGFLTSYQYGTLSMTVTQGGLNARSYNYDMLGRLTSESNPESGTVTSTYDSGTAGDLYQRIAPKPNQTNPATKVTTTYSFDALHRLSRKDYSDGTLPAIFLYDTNPYVTVTNGLGRLVHQTNSTSAGTHISYDAMGRISKLQDCIQPACGVTGFYTTSYTYDSLGDISTLVNSVENKTYTYNTAARLTSMLSNYNDANHPGTLLTVNQYNPLGQVQQATLGNGIVRNLQYDHRGRVTSLTDGSLYSFTLGYQPDSDVHTANDSLNGNWTYAYNGFNRLSQASRTGQAFTYKYDRFGNRWQQNVTTGSGPNPSYTFDANNHITSSGIVYDAAGNITNDGLGHTYTYDAENRLLTVAGATSASYVYDASGRRVQETIGAASKDYIFDQGGRVITQMSPGWARSELYAGGLHVATYTNSTTYFDHRDWLGTVRARSSVSGASVETCTSLPFGDAQTCTGTDWSPLHFTGQDWDSESNLTHFMFRQLSMTEGRWTSPDPAGMGAVSPGDPQTWNRYSYVENNPLSATDPLGLWRSDVFGTAKFGNDPFRDPGGAAFAAVLQQFYTQAGFGSPLQEGLTSYLSSIPGYNVRGGELYSHFGFYTPNPAYDPNDPDSLVGTSTSIDVDLGPVSVAANSGSWAWNFTKSFFTGFSVFGPKSDPRPSCFGQFLADAGSGFVNSFLPPSPSPGEIVGVGTAMYDYPNEVGIVAEQHLAQYGSRISKYTIGKQAGARAGLAGLLANADYQGAVALVNEYGSASSGQCK